MPPHPPRALAATLLLAGRLLRHRTCSCRGERELGVVTHLNISNRFSRLRPGRKRQRSRQFPTVGQGKGKGELSRRRDPLSGVVRAKPGGSNHCRGRSLGFHHCRQRTCPGLGALKFPGLERRFLARSASRDKEALGGEDLPCACSTQPFCDPRSRRAREPQWPAKTGIEGDSGHSCRAVGPFRSKKRETGSIVRCPSVGHPTTRRSVPSRRIGEASSAATSRTYPRDWSSSAIASASFRVFPKRDAYTTVLFMESFTSSPAACSRRGLTEGPIAMPC